MGASNRRGLSLLVDEHYESLYRYAMRLSGSSADAEDLTQEAFCKAQTQIAQLRDPDRARPWLFAILRNAYLQRIRADRNIKAVSLDAVGDVPERTGAVDPEIGPEQLQRALNDLPEGFRTPVILFYFEEMSYRDIAEQMDLPIGTVMSRLARGKAFLKDRLRPGTPTGDPRDEATNGL
ncbi:RNA polymerase sigma factor [Zavarzinella formosa]|uniref:RNA polymerase sigma factor n=1 Tax=Zavarzinella formosa TaxID=360055 RepID=UPI0003032577|nr:sigma-70 family RNA polymerase sigma factor [Zavarzinella formosa]